MLFVLFVNSIILLFLCFYSFGKSKRALALGCVVMFLFYSIRKDYGNDYATYFEMYNRFSSYTLKDVISDSYSYYEVGWRWLCYLFRNLSFNWLVAFCQAVSTLAIYLICKFCVPRKLALFAMFVYLCTPDFMLIQLSMMREGLSLSLIMIGVVLYIKKELIVFPLLFSGLAYLFHYTSIIFIVFFVVLYLYRKFCSKLNFIYAILSFLVIAFMFVEIVFSRFVLFSSFIEDLSKYENYLTRTDGMSLGLGNFVEFMLTGFPVFYTYRWLKNKRDVFLAQLFLVSFIFLPLAFRSIIFQRLSLYFSIFSICVLPISFFVIKDLLLRKAYLILYILFTLFRFLSFFSSSVYGAAYSEYHTIFD